MEGGEEGGVKRKEGRGMEGGRGERGEEEGREG